jgi:Cu-Zn family superoxide dismutase
MVALRIRGAVAALVVVAAVAVVAACGRRTDVSPARPAAADRVPGAVAVAGAPPGGVTVELIGRDGRALGVARLEPAGQGVRVSVRVSGLTPHQEHGIHLHAIGQCALPDFQSAGAHFNPDGRQHGLDNPHGPHAGDMPNLRADAAGVADTTIVAPFASLLPGAANSLLRAGGTALVVHAQPDDQRTDPTGNSGDRIACGVIAVAGG